MIVLIKSSGQQGANSRTQQAQDDAVRNFTENARAFTGLFEPMHMIREGSLRDGTTVFADWGTCIGNLGNAPGLQSFWEESYADYENWDRNEAAIKADELLAFTREAGVRRSEDREVNLSSDISRYYDIRDGADIEPDSVITIDFPYWSLRDTVLEKGQISVTNETDV